MTDKKTIVVTTGGTGGHMFPASSFAQAAIDKGYKVSLITDIRGSEFKGSFAKESIYKIKASSPRGGFFKLIKGVFNLGIGFLQSFNYLGKIKPSVVVAFGGYASAPTVVAALFRFIPVVLHEQNAILGKANRFSVKFVKLLTLSFKETMRIPKSTKTAYVGLPVRKAIKNFANSPYPVANSNDDFNVLVFGGSQGAKIFSLVVPYAVSFLEDEFKKRINIVQQCRESEKEEVQKIYDKTGIKYELVSFINDMENKIKDSHLIICRAGASTIAEANVIGRPMIMVPLKISYDGDQAANAKNVQDAGAGWIIEEDKFNPAELKKTVEYLMKNPMFLQEAAYNSSKMGVVNASENLLDIVIKEYVK